MGINTKRFDSASDMITFSRASGAYGLTKVSYGPELVTNGTFDTDTTGWLPTGNCTISAINGGAVITYTAASNGAFQFITGLTVGNMYSFSVSAKLNTGSAYSILISASDSTFPYVSSANGTSASFETITGTFVATETTHRFYIRCSNSVIPASASFDNISVKEVLYNSSAADATLQLIYHPDNVPRIEYNVDGSAKGILVEEARTNLFTQSNLSNWLTTGGASISTNYASSPENTQNATALIANSSDCRAYVVKTLSGSGHTFSVYAKKGENRYLMLRLSASGGQYRRYFDLQDGVLAGETGSGSASIQEVNGGWYRCSITTADTPTSSQNVLLASTNQDGTESGSVTSGVGVYLFGAQLEAGTFPTSYIETTGSTATRMYDVATIGVGEFGYNLKKNTLVVQVASNAPDNNQGTNNANNALVLLTTSATNNVALGISSTSSRVDRVTVTTRDNAGGGQGLDLPDNTIPYTTPATSVKIGTTWSTLDDVFKLTADGVATVTSSMNAAGDIVPFINLQIKEGQGSAHIKSIQYYPRRLTDAQIQRLTQPISTPTLSLTFDGQATSFTEDSIHG